MNNNNIFPTKLLSITDISGSMFTCCKCPKCNTINWVYTGNLNDETSCDIDGFECYNCSEEFYFSEAEKYYRTNISAGDEKEAWETAIFEKGEKEIPDKIKEFLKTPVKPTE